MIEIYKTHKGWNIRKREGKRWMYVAGTNKGKYSFVTDYTYAKTFSEDTARKHMETLEGR